MLTRNTAAYSSDAFESVGVIQSTGLNKWGASDAIGPPEPGEFTVSRLRPL